MTEPRATRLARLGAASARHPWRFVVAWVVVTAAAFAVAVGGITGQSLFDRLGSGSPSAPGEATDGRTLLAELEPQPATLLLQVRGADLSDKALLADATTATERLAATPGVSAVRSPLLLSGGVANPGAAALLLGGSAVEGGFLTVVDLDPVLPAGDTEKTRTDLVHQRLDAVTAALPGATGVVGSGDQLRQAITSQIEVDLRFGEGIALPLSFVVMFFVFGGFVAAGMPIVGAVTAIGGALASLFGFSHVIDLDASVVNVVTLLGLGLSIDYGLLTVSRYREELAAIASRDTDHRRHVFSRDDILQATSRTVATAGRTVLFSGLTVAIALAGLLAFPAEIMRAIGAAGVSVVLVALVVDLTLLPALCALGTRRLLTRGTEHGADTGVFSRLAHGVQRRPVTVVVVTLAALVALAGPALGMRLTSSAQELLPIDSPQRVFFDDLATDYPALTTAPITVVARTPLSDARAWAAADVATLPGVTSAVARSVTPDVSAVAVRVTGAVSGPVADQVVTTLHDQRPAFTTLVTGPTAGQQDFLDSMRGRAPLAGGFVVLGTFVLLFLMTGSVVLPLKALVLNVVSLGAALGVLVLVFQDGHLEGAIDFTSVGAIESLIPFLALAFGFGLSMDYEVFLLARIAELHRRGVPNDESVSLGLQRSGRIITSAALLVIIVFAGFVAGKLLVIKEIGFALVVAVAIDATLVRMLLVPATMTLLGRWNWWAPAPLRRWHDRHGVSE
ncbi:MAG: MMPL family transporter [Lapillicoccus sp.]